MAGVTFAQSDYKIIVGDCQDDLQIQQTNQTLMLVDDAVMSQFVGAKATEVKANADAAAASAATAATSATSAATAATALQTAVKALPAETISTTKTLTATQAGELLVMTADLNITSNAAVAIPLYTVINFYNDSAVNRFITADATVTLRLAGTSQTGQRTIIGRGFGTLVKVKPDEWVAMGPGVS